MPYFKKKPVVIEAMQFTDEMKDRCYSWVGSNRYARHTNDDKPELVITTLEGDMVTSIGDWIIKGIKGEFYPCKPDIFEATYEAVEQPLE